MLDDTDRRLLRQLQADPTIRVSELADRCGLTSATTTRRLDRMTDQGILCGQRTVIDWKALGYAVEVSLRFTLDKAYPNAQSEFQAEARKIPEVLEIQSFLGRVDLRLSVIARDLEHYQALYRDRILTLPHIAEIEALMHIATIKTEETLPV